MEISKLVPIKIYLSYSIAGASDEYLKFVEEVANRLQALGFEVVVPHLRNYITVSEVFNGDSEAIDEAEVVVALLNRPSTGMGLELALSYFLETKQIIGIYIDDLQAPLSRFVEGFFEFLGRKSPEDDHALIKFYVEKGDEEFTPSSIATAVLTRVARHGVPTFGEDQDD